MIPVTFSPFRRSRKKIADIREATAKRRKAPENGPTLWANTRPAMNVPPQQRAISRSLM
jgi:hypothetical protein